MGCKRTTRSVITFGIGPIPPTTPTPTPTPTFRCLQICQGLWQWPGRVPPICSRSCPFSLGSRAPYIAENPNQVVLFTRYVSYGIVVCISVRRVPATVSFYAVSFPPFKLHFPSILKHNIYIYATNFCRLKYLIGSDVDVDNKLILHKRFKWGLRSDKLKGFAGEILFFQKNSATTSQSESKQVQCEVKTLVKQVSFIYVNLVKVSGS